MPGTVGQPSRTGTERACEPDRLGTHGQRVRRTGITTSHCVSANSIYIIDYTPCFRICKAPELSIFNFFRSKRTMLPLIASRRPEKLFYPGPQEGKNTDYSTVRIRPPTIKATPVSFAAEHFSCRKNIPSRTPTGRLIWRNA